MVQVSIQKTKHCLMCPREIAKGNGFTTGYLYTESGRSLTSRTWFCSEKCLNNFLRYFANPVFQNEKARQRFMTKHPDRYNRIAAKPKLFLEG